MESKFGIEAFYYDKKERPQVCLKRSPKDFIVQEVCLDGTICDSTEDYRDPTLKPTKTVSTVPTIEDLTCVGINADEAKEILELANKPDGSIILSNTFDKSQRTAIHALFKSFPKLVTDSPAPGKLRVSKKSSSAPYDVRNNQDPHSVPYVKCVMSKTCYDTAEAVSMIARAMGNRNLKDFSFAGTKDRRAVTHQQLVIRNCNPSRLLGINKVLAGQDQARRVMVSGVERVEDALRLGQLLGNRFKITLYPFDSHTFKCNIQTIDNVFVNYFGLQRFGTHSTSTDQIGEALLKQDYALACSLIIPDRFPDLKAAFTAGEYAQALSVCPQFLHSESALIAHLVDHQFDFEGALMRLPKETRMLYVHAWQSLQFNKMASARIRLSRDALMVGDLVMTEDETVLSITEENLKEFTVFDIVIPLPGHKVKTHDYSDYAFTPRNPAMYDLPGCYRKLLARAEDLTISGDDHQIVLEFTLASSCYATMFLREHFECIEE